MDTKLKNSVLVIVWLLLFTYGLSGILSLLNRGSMFMEGYSNHAKIAFFIWTMGGVIAFLLSLYLLKKSSVTWVCSYLDEKWQSYYNRIPIDAGVLLFLITILPTISVLSYNYPVYDFIQEIIINAILVALTLIQIIFLSHRLKDMDNPEAEWNKSLLSRTYKTIGEAFLVRSNGFQMVILLGVIFATGFGLTVVFSFPAAIIIYVPLFLIVTLPTLVILSKRCGYFNRMVSHTSELVRGNIGPDLPAKGNSALATLAGNINTLKHGVAVSNEKQAKSERLKTELITNVSHDLRTPLTSIMTYTELLKTPDLAEGDRTAYIQILDRKSKRLKVLIEDLFEASKMASGNIELVKEEVDIIQLLQQALAENDEKINESPLQFRVIKPDMPVVCIGDGQKLWRVFDNLIGNILKYALENTRVYISVKTLHDQVLITFKNITKYELSENIDELFERFKRGDTSRHTDGSGLGLAIAKSIVDLHGGSLDIEVDGDLFKATVSLESSF